MATRIAKAALFALFVAFSTVSAEEDVSVDEPEVPQDAQRLPPHPLTDIPPPSPYVVCQAEMKGQVLERALLRAGEEGTLLVKVTNTGEEPVTLAGFMGSLNSPYDFSKHVMNFTGKAMGDVVEPGSEVEVTYEFVPFEKLIPFEYLMAHTLFYTGQDNAVFADTVFNQTVTIEEKVPYFDWQLWSLFLMFGAAGVGVFYWAYATAAAAWAPKKAKKVKKTTAPSAAQDPNQWLQGTSAAAKKDKKK